jgi:hypothetical protein
MNAMSEQSTNFGELTLQEFEQVMDKVAAPDFHDLITEDFFYALVAIDAEITSDISTKN